MSKIISNEVKLIIVKIIIDNKTRIIFLQNNTGFKGVMYRDGSYVIKLK